ncbi:MULTISPECIES: SDR family oxidoreductase [Maricaulis]|uniref:Dehydrogenase n=1 Tax=Maricaulis virginensis TaxID=144022 RepID=A0A9W6IK63_9PROT|nr:MULTISPECIES: SDR family NAD(P)-dependent oxidoreductase [Maricaulis]MBO6765021.1 SDR family NAD(P)-dependent oxidoreductase [Maricaulis sp.]GLK51067.1 dehydrogenase [Maricaulis virginensis]
MDYTNKVVAITGGARGIGLAMAQAFHARGAKIALADLQGAEEAAQAFGGIGATVDVTKEADIAAFLDRTEAELGPVDIYVSNAGILRADAPSWDAAGASDKDWLDSFEVNVMGAVRGARQVWPRMKPRGGGVFILVASAAGLLAQIGASSYTASKHAAVSFAESLAITHGDDGLQVVCVCPQAVRTAMLGENSSDGGIAGADGVVEPSDVAAEAIAAIEEKRFLALPHASVAGYEAARATQRDRWLGGMRKFRRMMVAERGRPV